MVHGALHRCKALLIVRSAVTEGTTAKADSTGSARNWQCTTRTVADQCIAVVR